MARSLPQIRGRVILKPRPEDYRSLPSFGYFNLTQLARSDPAVYAAVTSTPRPSTPPEDPESSKKKTKAPRKPTDPEKPVPDAVGYTPQPPMSPGRPQRLCAICSTPIAHGEGQDFTGNLPCRHRGTCSSRFCILAYYGSLDRWALPYTGLMPIYCRAPGCGAKVEAWCQVRCRESDGGVGKVAHTDSYRDPKVVKAEEKRRHRELQRERKASALCCLLLPLHLRC
ncbi:hypothetical protein QBC40DRAFT_347136 [Triangularia verruculosa]|uniref:Uncharacterized protein n=1 Tax=Triangularia verruculosa TaxID=2587418 RepID=A0AAN7AXB8_9PEZI|nr:hypothetical protein QBC40DRAFT_347136 [Triangularia verruculosa]